MKSPPESQPDIKAARPREEVREVQRTDSEPSLACGRLTCRRGTRPPWRRHSGSLARIEQRDALERAGSVALTAKVRVGGDRQSKETWDAQQAPLIRRASVPLKASGGLSK